MGRNEAHNHRLLISSTDMATVPLAQTQSFPMPLMTGGTLVTDAGTVEGEFAVNLKFRQVATNNKTGTCTSHGGLTEWMASTVRGESDRGGILWNGYMYRVQGASVYQYSTAGVRTLIGTVANDGLKCRLDYSFDFLMIVSAGKLYYYCPSGFSTASSVAVSGGGLSYAVGDTITLGALGLYATVTVTAINSGTQASATAQLTGSVVSGFIVTNGGTGYSNPTVTIGAPPSGGTTATARAIVDDGVITEILVVDGGSGYGTVVPTVTISAPDGGGVVSTASVTNAPQVLTEYLPTNPVAQVLSSGGGTGASFNVTWESKGNFIQVDMDLSAGITTVTDACYMAGYIMVTDGVDVWCSSLVNLAFFPGYYGSAEYDPDGIVAIYKLNNQLYVLGKNTTQTMANTGGNNFPFTAQSSYTFDIGCVSRQTMCYTNHSLAWIGGGRNMPNGVWFLNGNSPNKISSAAVDYELAQLTADQVAVVTMESMSFEDSEFIYVHLPRKTLVFDFTATTALGVKFWTQLNSGPTSASYYRARNFVQFNGMWAAGDVADNRIGYLDSTTGGHYGEPVINRSTGPLTMLPLASAALRSVELKCITGQAGDTSRVGMSYSADGIRWSQVRFAPAAPRGAYANRIIWRPGALTIGKMQMRIEHITTQHVTWFSCDLELEALNA